MSESSKYFCSCGKTTLLDGSQSCLCDEIERLLEESRINEAKYEEYRRLSNEMTDNMKKRIEELEKELNAAKWWADKRDICWDDLIGGEDD